MATVICDRCGEECHSDGFSAGYAISSDWKRYCFKCCGEIAMEKLKKMKQREKIILYLIQTRENRWEITNWTGTFRIPVFISKGRHNFAGVRYDCKFEFNGHRFHGVCYGNDTQVCHIKCLKAKENNHDEAAD